MSLYDEQYLNIVERILKDGYYDNNRTGISTYKLPHQVMQFDLQKEFPILTTKKVAFKTAVKDYYDMIYYALTEQRPMEITPEQVLTQLKVIDKIRAQNPLTIEV